MTVSAHKLIIFQAVRYLDAACVLHFNSPAPNGLWDPLNHLFAMSAELALKAFLERMGVSESDLKSYSDRHALSRLLRLAIGQGLRTTEEVAAVLMQMDEAHRKHHYRYVPRPPEGENITVYSASPSTAIKAIQRLIDQCSADPADIRGATHFPERWSPAVLPVTPLTIKQLDDSIA